MIGDSRVGKSSLLLRYVDQRYSGSFISTIGIDFKTKKLEIDGEEITMQIWDTSGQERFRSITTSYFKGANAMILAFDLTDLHTFNRVSNWIKEVNRLASDDTILYLVGTKQDLKRQVTEEAAKALAEKYQLKYIETSAKNPVINGIDTVDKLFTELAKMMGQKMLDKASDKVDLNAVSKRSKCC